ncbi:hypothetical protein C8T65DRAFT_743951 [Cerioporus squamosus]|nr:hypothetical protein C8T65DRAFT_743951 [Cerioporus squamosus]
MAPTDATHTIAALFEKTSGLRANSHAPHSALVDTLAKLATTALQVADHIASQYGHLDEDCAGQSLMPVLECLETDARDILEKLEGLEASTRPPESIEADTSGGCVDLPANAQPGAPMDPGQLEHLQEFLQDHLQEHLEVPVSIAVETRLAPKLERRCTQHIHAVINHIFSEPAHPLLSTLCNALAPVMSASLAQSLRTSLFEAVLADFKAHAHASMGAPSSASVVAGVAVTVGGKRKHGEAVETENGGTPGSHRCASGLAEESQSQ